jgi:hypothetical protein
MNINNFLKLKIGQDSIDCVYHHFRYSYAIHKAFYILKKVKNINKNLSLLIKYRILPDAILNFIVKKPPLALCRCLCPNCTINNLGLGVIHEYKLHGFNTKSYTSPYCKIGHLISHKTSFKLISLFLSSKINYDAFNHNHTLWFESWRSVFRNCSIPFDVYA